MRAPVLSKGGCRVFVPGPVQVSRRALLKMQRRSVLHGNGAGRGLGWSENCFGGTSQGRMFVGRRLMRGRRAMKRNAAVVAELKGKGKRFLARDIRVKKIMGEGSFGQVFEGLLANRFGEEPIVLKRVKTRVQGAQEMVEMEHLLNVYAAKAARGSVADFMGYCGVNREEASGLLSDGLWLVWRYEGWKTLHYYLKRRDCIAALALDMGIPESAVAPTVVKQILEALKGLHDAGLVHRDVKPSNLIFVESTKSFKLIDLGACADLRSGTNYVPDESILDPVYCPPEEYILPTDSPSFERNMFSGLISPMLWAHHMPDRFDIFSAGLILMQLSVSSLHKDAAIKRFRDQLESHDFDLHRWRKSAVNFKSVHSGALDATNEAGWNLAATMLKPRKIERCENGNVKFIHNGSTFRLSAVEALKHSFFKKATEPMVASRPSLSLWRSFTHQLMDLENKIIQQTIATNTQTTTVKKLRSKFATGKASKSELEREENLLSTMTNELDSLSNQFEDTARQALNIFGIIKNPFGMFSGQTEKQSTSKAGSTKAAVEDSIETSVEGSTDTSVEDSFEVAVESSIDSTEENERVQSSSSKAPFSLGWLNLGKSKSVEKSKTEGMKKKDEPPLSEDVSEKVVSKEPAMPTASEDVSEKLVSKEPAVSTATEDFLRIGKKFTGLATRIAADLSVAVKDDVITIFTGFEELAQDKRNQLRAEEEYLSLLKRCEPPLPSSTKFSSAEKMLVSDTNVLDLPPEARRVKLFNRFIVALKRKEEKAQRIALNDLKAMYAEMKIGPKTSWASVSSRLEGTSVFEAVSNEKARKDLFDEMVAVIAAREEEEERQTDIEMDFRAMLKEMEISSSDSWARVKVLAFSDPRYKRTPSSSRQNIYEEYIGILLEEECSKSAEEQKDTNISLLDAADMSKDEEKDAALDLADQEFQELKAEQVKLKEEYKQMAERLKEMESKMKATIQEAETSTTYPVGQDDDVIEGSKISPKAHTSSNGSKPVNV